MRTAVPLALALALVVAVVGCASGQKPGAPTEARQVAIDIELDTQGQPLGAYQIAIAYEKDEVRIVDVRAAAGSQFQGAPNFDPGTFSLGQTRVTGYAHDKTAPSGPYRLLTVVFERTAAVPRSAFDVRVEGLYAPEKPSRPIPQHRLSLSRPLLDFTQPQ